MREQQVFILRRWRDNDTTDWRLSLKNIETKEIRYFPSEEALTKHLLNTPEGHPLFELEEGTL